MYQDNISDNISDTVRDNAPKAILEPLSVRKSNRGKVFVQGSFANSQTRRLFEIYGYDIVESIEEADIVCWTGGEDINPKIYGEKPAGVEYFSTRRDGEDIAAIDKSKDKFKVGICRGAQLLNCYPNMGTLWQDVNNHGGGKHLVKDVITGHSFYLNSLHHQGIRLTDKAELVAFTNISTEKYSYSMTWHSNVDDPDPDVEAAWYPATRSFLIQGHPEFDPNGETGIYFSQLLERYFLAA